MIRAAIGLTVVALILTFPLGLSGQPQAVSEESPADVARLVRDLASPEFSVREAALRALEKKGPEAIVPLREALKQQISVEARRRIEDLITRLERSAALEPTRLTLHVNNRPLKLVLEDISKLSGYSVKLQRYGDEREKQLVTMRLTNATFWEAIEELCALCGLVYLENYYSRDYDTIYLGYGESFPGVVSCHGPFRVAVRSFRYRRDIDFTSQSVQGQKPRKLRRQSLTVIFSISVEPKLPLVYASQPTITEAFDDLNQPMVKTPASRTTTYYYYGGSRRLSHTVQAELEPAQGGRCIRSLRGEIPVTVIAVQRPRLVVHNIMKAKGVEVKQGESSLRIEDVTKAGEDYRISVVLKDGTTDGQQKYNWFNSLQFRLVLIDNKGNRCYGRLQWSSNGLGNNRFNGTVIYSPGSTFGEPAQLVYYDWQTLAHSVPFHFKSLILP